MPAERKYIYWGDSIARIADPLTVLLGGEGAAVNAIADRYDELIRRERPELTLDEWCAVCEANDGVSFDAFAHRKTPMLQLIGEEDEDGEIRDSDPAKKWDVDAAKVNVILSGLSFGGRLAVLHVVESVWADPTRNARAVIQEVLSR